MDKKALRAISVGICLLFVRQSFAEGKVPACQAALAKVDYGNLLIIPEETRALIESYRSGWRVLCDPKSERKSSLAELLTQGKVIEKKFQAIYDAEHHAPSLDGSDAANKRADAIHNLVENKFLSFIPAFKGSYLEYEYFAPNIVEFKKLSTLGNVEDKQFFESQIPLEGDFVPYIEMTWDYGGCLLFGRFNWAEELKKIAGLKQKVKSEIYKKEISSYEQGLVGSLGVTTDICTCDDKSAVTKDLAEVQAYIQKEPSLASYLPSLQETLALVQSGKIKINSEKEKHCSGG